MNPAEEFEAKFRVPGPDALERAPALLRELGATLGRKHRIRMRDIYLDTEDRWLLRAGIGLRARLMGRRGVLTVKTRRSASGRMARRIEWEEPHAAGALRFPGPLPRGRIAAWLRRSRGIENLRPLVEMEHERDECAARLPGGAGAKVCLDRVRIIEGGMPRNFYEVEIERTDGDPRHLARFARKLERRSGWARDPTAKLERALRMVGVEPPAPPNVTFRVRPGQSLGEAAAGLLRERFAEFLWCEPGARAGFDPEFLHDMRVAARRMRAALRLFRGALPAPFMHRAEEELRRLFAVMGRVRDLDVGLEMLRQRAGDRPSPGIAAWIGKLERRRHRAWNRLLRCFGGERFTRFVEFMKSRLAEGAFGGEAAPAAARRVGDHAPKMLRRRFRKALDAAFALEAGAPEAVFHRARIRFKKLRYAIECFADIRPRATRKLCRELAELQDVLGAFQDEVVLRTLLREGGDRNLTPALIAARERLERDIARHIADRQREFLRLREQLKSREFRRLADKLSARA